MPETVADHQPSAGEIAACHWLTDPELAVYAGEYARTGFQGGLQWYRCGTSGKFRPELEVFSGRTIDVPSCFIAGASDWGTYQRPGDYEKMQREVKDFEWKVRQWAAEVPITSNVYLALDPLNHCLQLMTRVLNGEKDGSGFERRYGEGGIE